MLKDININININISTNINIYPTQIQFTRCQTWSRVGKGQREVLKDESTAGNKYKSNTNTKYDQNMVRNMSKN